MTAISNIASENGAWRWQGSRGAKMRADGSTTKSERTSIAKSISHEHTFDEDTGDAERLQSTLMRLSEMVGRRLREGGYFARTLQLKLRYKDFTTITRAHSLEQPTQMDNQIFEQARRLFFANWKPGAPVRLLGVQASNFESGSAQLDLLEPVAAAALAECAGGRGSSARQVWRIGHRPGPRNERRIPRTHA